MKLRTYLSAVLILWFLACGFSACTTLPEIHHEKYEFPEAAYKKNPSRKYKVLGWVRSKVNFQTLDPIHDEDWLCRNYYNKAASELVSFAKKQGGDAVIDVKSVVYLVDGTVETYPTPECSDDGEEGQVLARGIAVRWLNEGSNKHRSRR